MKIRNQNHDEQVKEIIEEMKAQGVLDEILPPGQTGIIEIEFSGRTIQCQVRNQVEDRGLNQRRPEIVE